MSRRVVVVGAGITGLTVAYRISHAPVAAEVLVVDTDREPGGVIRSVQVGDLELEAGPDSFLVGKPWAMDLCYELELERELVPQGAIASQILTPTRSASGPARAPRDPGLGDRSAAMEGDVRRRSAPARWRSQPFTRRRSGADRSVGQLLRRRLGRGATNALVAPLLSGISAADIDLLSVDAAFPRAGAVGPRARQPSRGCPRESDAGPAGPRRTDHPVRDDPGRPTALPDALAEAARG